ncbi:hypothetical protein SAMN04488168_11013 [Bacillus sp. 491mf]|nr:hypothetical protein SAMN04488168_11013 [Bacillus sp. 491mf]
MIMFDFDKESLGNSKFYNPIGAKNSILSYFMPKGANPNDDKTFTDRDIATLTYHIFKLNLKLTENHTMVTATWGCCFAYKRGGYSRRIFTTYISAWLGAYYINRGLCLELKSKGKL